MKKTKQNIREQILQIRKNLTVAEKVKLSRSILRNLFLLPDFQKAGMIHTYISSKSNEVDTLELIVEVLSQNKNIIVPIANPKTKMMTHSFLFSFNDLQKGAFDILEPKNIIPATIEQINIALIPVVAVDHHGNRIGFGAGFYDRFLQSLRCVKIGLAYDFQIVESIPKEEHDVQLDYIVSNNRTITCNENM
jgi:5-formyltetrahydrofolate cyclo-ligase